jgi:hypothetical protein
MAHSNQNGEPMRRPLPESVIEQLAELWCDVFMANLRRHPIPPERAPVAIGVANAVESEGA